MLTNRSGPQRTPLTCAQTKTSDRVSKVRGMTLVEVMIACIILTMVMLGVLQGSLQSRRMTEGSIRQITVASLVQGYLEQMKGFKYESLTVSPTATPGTGLATDWDDSNVALLKDSSQNNVRICLAVGTAPTSLPDISTLPTDASLHTENVDIDNTNSGTDDTVLNMWVWVNSLTGGNVADCKSIVIVYQWKTRDGGRIHTYSDMMRTIRSSIPTD
jgi:Tfp pilus assembly protein PilV